MYVRVRPLNSKRFMQTTHIFNVRFMRWIKHVCRLDLRFSCNWWGCTRGAKCLQLRRREVSHRFAVTYQDHVTLWRTDVLHHTSGRFLSVYKQRIPLSENWIKALPTVTTVKRDVWRSNSKELREKKITKETGIVGPFRMYLICTF